MTTDYFHQPRTDMASPASAMIVGAAVGVAIGYLFFTEHGRRVRLRAESLLNVSLSDLERFRDTVQHVAKVYGDSLESGLAMENTPRASLR